MATADMKKQMDERIDLNTKLKNLLTDLDHIETYCRGTEANQNSLREQLTGFQTSAKALDENLAQTKAQLDPLIQRINDFLEDTNAFERLGSIEDRLPSLAEASALEPLKRKANELSRKLTTVSVSLNEYARRSDVDDELETLRNDLEASKQNEVRLQQTIDALTRRVKELESKPKMPADMEERMRDMYERLQRLEAAEHSLTARSDTSTATESHMEESTETSTQTSTVMTTVVTEDTDAGASADDILTKAGAIIGQSTATKQEILIESLTSISEILDRHGIN